MATVPHAAWVALVDPAAQKYPASHCPVHVATDRPVVDPYVPAGHGVFTPPVQYDPVSHVVTPLLCVTSTPVVYSPGVAVSTVAVPAGQ